MEHKQKLTTTLMTRAEVMAALGVSTSALYRIVKAGEFPKPIRVGKQAQRWRTDQVQRWLDEQTAAAV